MTYTLGTEVKGDSGQCVSFDGQFVQISQKGIAALFAGRSVKRVHVSQLTSVGYKPPFGVTPGWIRFATAGSGEAARAGFGNRGFSARHDENAVLVPKSRVSQFLELRNAVELAVIALNH